MNLFVLDPNGNLFIGISFLKRRLQKMFGFVTGVRSGQFEITFFFLFFLLQFVKAEIHFFKTTSTNGRNGNSCHWLKAV